MNDLDEPHGGVAPELEHRCARDSDWCDGKLCVELGVLCPFADALNNGEWPFDDEPPDPL